MKCNSFWFYKKGGYRFPLDAWLPKVEMKILFSLNATGSAESFEGNAI